MIAVAEAIIQPTPSAHPGNLYPSYDIPINVVYCC